MCTYSGCGSWQVLLHRSVTCTKEPQPQAHYQLVLLGWLVQSPEQDFFITQKPILQATSPDITDFRPIEKFQCPVELIALRQSTKVKPTQPNCTYPCLSRILVPTSRRRWRKMEKKKREVSLHACLAHSPDNWCSTAPEPTQGTLLLNCTFKNGITTKGMPFTF